MTELGFALRDYAHAVESRVSHRIRAESERVYDSLFKLFEEGKRYIGFENKIRLEDAMNDILFQGLHAEEIANGNYQKIHAKLNLLEETA